MEKITGNEPAIPHRDESVLWNHGLTIRQHFAGLAMQGLLSGATKELRFSDLAKQSITAADALIEQLNK